MVRALRDLDGAVWTLGLRGPSGEPARHPGGGSEAVLCGGAAGERPWRKGRAEAWARHGPVGREPLKGNWSRVGESHHSDSLSQHCCLKPPQYGAYAPAAPSPAPRRLPRAVPWDKTSWRASTPTFGPKGLDQPDSGSFTLRGREKGSCPTVVLCAGSGTGTLLSHCQELSPSCRAGANLLGRNALSSSDYT